MTQLAATPAAKVRGSAPRPIRVLSTLVANQIAAGEVVERPASVVKEVVENSLDAGATRIRVELEQGGIELIRVTDDGHGMRPDDLPLAISPHATSKIAAVEDLDRIGSLGFRGEALASIASVSRLSIRSRTALMDQASIIEIEGADVRPVAPASGPPGTQTTCRNLFFNTPARRKFLRTVPTEQGRCRDVIEDLALAHPAVGFTLVCDGRVVLELSPGHSPRERALAVLGRELEPELLEVHADQFDDARGLALWGLIGKPSIARGNNKGQHILVNGRAIRDRTIQHAIAEGFRGLVEHTRYPMAVLLLEMAPAGVDVNVHPAKAEVRFRDSSMVHSTVLRAVRESLRAADLTPTMGVLASAPAAVVAWSNLPGSGLANPDAVAPAYPAREGGGPRAFVDYFTRFSPRESERLAWASGSGAGAASGAANGVASALHASPLQPNASGGTGGLSEAGSDNTEGVTNGVSSETDPVASSTSDEAVIAGIDAPSLPPPTPHSRVLQVHKSYLVTQDEQGMVIIDQHALHERAMFEYLLARVMSRAEAREGAALESQHLLTPFVVPASPAQVEGLSSLQPLLMRIGVEARELSPTSVGLYSFPTFLFDRGVDAVEFMGELLVKAESNDFAPNSEEAMRDVLDMMSCKAAVKAGDRLSEVELAELVKLRGEVERSSNCPHGRPTSIRLTIAQLEKLFGRA